MKHLAKKSTVYLVNGTLGKAGLQLRKLPKPGEEVRLPEIPSWDPTPFIWLSSRKIKMVLDIGANNGQFATEIRRILPIAKIISFEPLKDVYAELVKKGKELKQFQAFNFALGNKKGHQTIHRSEFSPSSSLLPMGQLHKDVFPHTKKTFVEKIEIRRLDDLDIKITKPLMVKIDVQGFEDQVIDGGKKIISQADVILTEVSFQKLYDGQALFNDIYQRLHDLGFEFHGHWFQDVDPRDGSAVQADAIFIKKK